MYIYIILDVFPMNIAKFLRTPTLRNICKRLLLKGLLMRVLSKEKLSNLFKGAVGYFLMFLFQ